jgi:hypothetical protein
VTLLARLKLQRDALDARIRALEEGEGDVLHPSAPWPVLTDTVRKGLNPMKRASAVATLRRIAKSVNDRMGTIQGRSLFDDSPATIEIQELRELADRIENEGLTVPLDDLVQVTIDANGGTILTRLSCKNCGAGAPVATSETPDDQ